MVFETYDGVLNCNQIAGMSSSSKPLTDLIAVLGQPLDFKGNQGVNPTYWFWKIKQKLICCGPFPSKININPIYVRKHCQVLVKRINIYKY